MYCIKCGQRLDENSRFCIKCGQKQGEILSVNENNSFTTTTTNSKKLLAYYIAVLTSPLILVFRLVAQTTESYEVNNWGAIMTRERTYLPGEMQVVLFVLLAISTFLVISLRRNSSPISKAKSAATIFFLIFNIIFGIAAATA